MGAPQEPQPRPAADPHLLERLPQRAVIGLQLEAGAESPMRRRAISHPQADLAEVQEQFGVIELGGRCALTGVASLREATGGLR